jgi:hypothetical protein
MLPFLLLRRERLGTPAAFEGSDAGRQQENWERPRKDHLIPFYGARFDMLEP